MPRSVVFRSHPKDHPIQSPITTHKGMWRIYSCPDPHGAGPSINYLQFYVSLKNCSVIRRRHNCQWLYVPLKNTSLTWRLIDLTDWLYIVLRPAQEFHLYGASQLSVKGQIQACARHSGPLRRGIFIVPHRLWQGPWFFQSHRKDRPIQSPLTTHKGMWRTYSNKDPHGLLIWRSHH
jgi:hypothetical protein